jgi:hypothetical protein
MNQNHYNEVISTLKAFLTNETENNEKDMIAKIDKLTGHLWSIHLHLSYYTSDEINIARDFLSEHNQNLFELLKKIKNCSLSDQTKEKINRLEYDVKHYP